jgi:predicted lipoprotein
VSPQTPPGNYLLVRRPAEIFRSNIGRLMNMRPLAPIISAALLLLTTGCKIVADGDQAAIDLNKPDSFNAQAYVGKLWDSKAAPYFQNEAHPVTAVLAALAEDKVAAGKAFAHRATADGTPWTFAVRGTGIVKSVNTESRHGEMVVEIGPREHPIEASLQIGPVIYGTAIRDSLPFIAFGDFVNQIQYAEVSRALNNLAFEAARKGMNPIPQAGQTVEFVGAMIDPSTAGQTTITPVSLQATGAAKQ